MTGKLYMDAVAIELEFALGKDHWWFEGRRRILREIIARMDLSAGAEIYDLGSGSGQNLAVLRSFGRVTAVDQNPVALNFCRRMGGISVLKADVTALPLAANRADLVVATDILEHLDDDRAGAAEIYRILKPSGRAVVTVPAFRWLWGIQDEVTNHRRRYTGSQLVELLATVGFEIERLTYFNFLLLPPIALARWIIRMSNIRFESENKINTPGLNWLLTQVFGLEALWLRRAGFPIGVSILAVAKKS